MHNHFKLNVALKEISSVAYHAGSSVATILGPPQTTCLDPWPKGYGNTSFWRAHLADPSALGPPANPSRAPHDCEIVADQWVKMGFL